MNSWKHPKEGAHFDKLNFWVLCDSAKSYAWNIQPYKGKETGSIPERNQGMP